MLEIVVTLFRIYFRLNTLRLCKNLIAAVERLDFNIFPVASRVSYKFFVGRLCILDDQYVSHLDAVGPTVVLVGFIWNPICSPKL